MERFLFLGIAGSLGVLARYGLNSWIQGSLGFGFPWGILTTNSIGCFAIGLVWSLLEQRELLNSELRIVILVGFLGAFTTLSTFAFDTVQLARAGQWLDAIGNLTLNNVLGIAFVLVGIWLGRAF